MSFRGGRQDRAVGEGQRRQRDPRRRGHAVRPAGRRRRSDRRRVQPVVA